MDSHMLRDMLVSALIAAFAATMLILYEPREKRPEFWSAVGRVGVAIIASFVVSALASDVFKLTPKVTFALAGASGIFGVRVFVALSRYAKKIGVNLDDAKEEEWSHKDDSVGKLEDKEGDGKKSESNKEGAP